MKTFKKVLLIIIAVLLLPLIWMMVDGVIWEIQQQIEYPEYQDTWYLAIIIGITILTVCIDVVLWYDSVFKTIIERDREYTEKQLHERIKQRGVSADKLNSVVSRHWFLTLPRRKRIEILKKVLEEIA